jgi:beta-glucosidase
MVGYRHYDAKGIKPRFPFGYGLSYTTFAYSGLKASTKAVQVTVTNTGDRTGVAVPQLYIGMPAAGVDVPQPPKQLKGYTKVTLAPGQSTTVTFPLSARSFSYWNEEAKAWKVADGCYKVMVGASSRQIAQTGTLGACG